MKNVTVTLDDEVAQWARVHAAELGTSVSRMLGELLREKMRDDRAYARAMTRYLARSPAVLKKAKTRYPSRDELYDRPVLRRH